MKQSGDLESSFAAHACTGNGPDRKSNLGVVVGVVEVVPALLCSAVLAFSPSETTKTTSESQPQAREITTNRISQSQAKEITTNRISQSRKQYYGISHHTYMENGKCNCRLSNSPVALNPIN